MLRTFYVWRNQDTQRIAAGEIRRARIAADSLREAGAFFASKLGPGTHEVSVSPCPTFPAAVHVLTCVVEGRQP